ncbi:MAG: aminomethyl-transferring glycine dehydrogenase [Bacteroidales bacterium]|jgi:glycine dehydrogenase|nr:aminomethyl-transferring glycine dehydrogenase [Bacteroidales bacterium]
MKNFVSRHTGPREQEISHMLSVIGVSSMDKLIDKALPVNIRLLQPLDLPSGISEAAYLDKLEKMASQNKIYRTCIGSGYYNTHLPSVIRRNILENPSWYTSYTPYQAEISQGRLEALLNFQTVVAELTGMDVAGASLLDEASAAAEAMMMMFRLRSREAIKNGVNRFFVDRQLFQQTIEVIATRAEPQGIEIITGDCLDFVPDGKTFGVMLQYPDRQGNISDYRRFTEQLHEAGIFAGVAADLLSLVILTPPGQWGADVVVGSSQRFGLPMGYGGPHAAYFATRDAFKRDMPGRIIGISTDAHGKKALRMALQTREQHIKRERATSNICTAQALPAIMAGMYAVYHGPEGLREIAERIHRLTRTLAGQIAALGFTFVNRSFFDTLTVKVCREHAEAIRKTAEAKGVNFRYEEGVVGISLDETTTTTDVQDIAEILGSHPPREGKPGTAPEPVFDGGYRKDDFLRQPVFNSYRSETEMMRYIKKLERRDISLTHSMIPLGSCTMKLNAATEMFALSMPSFGNLHPFAPKEQAGGYRKLIDDLSHQLAVITGFDAVSFQPNSGAAGEYAGLMVIRAYLKDTGQAHRNVALIPSSAHGTNPASAAMAGMNVVVVPDDGKGNIDITRLKELTTAHQDRLAVLMITYPSTHGVFEEGVKEIIDLVHRSGGQVYMDGANMNAQVGLTHPGFLGADACHLNLHKTFAIPHGGGGPGMGPICVAKHLTPYLPKHPEVNTGGAKGVTAIGAAPWGSASVLTIPHAYITMMGGEGLRQATCIAILNANYLAAKLRPYYETLYTNANRLVAHEMILSCKQFKDAGVTAADIAKRLMDYGFHAPTLSFPVPNTLMVEPTESESLQELDRFAAALIGIHAEIQDILNGKADAGDNLLKNAPHTEEEVVADNWTHPYSREQAAYPLEYIRQNKFWPRSSRVDDAYGDRNLQLKIEDAPQ